MADYQYLTDTGVILPDTADLLAEVEGEYRGVFGADLITTPNTPQGMLIAAEVLAREAVVRNNAALANQINPNMAGGVFLDAIYALTGGQRLPATYSVASGVELTGLPGTVVAAGARASTADGTLFASVSEVTLDSFGAAVVDFQALDPGPLSAPVGALNQIVTAVLGWDSVNNPAAATPGRNVATDQAARARRKNTLSLQNVALPEAITSALYALPNVRSLAFRENVTSSTATIDGISLLAHSIWVCVDGGTDAEVAAALLANKSLGCQWNGGTTVAVVEPASGQSYNVKFDRPTAVPVQARFYVRNNGALGNAAGTVRQAVLDFAAGLLEGESGFTVGADVSAFELAAAVNSQAPGIYVQKCEISLVSVTSWSTNEIVIALNQLATIIGGNIEVNVL
jgi:uncharacterized phage protein gp47/JayE